MNTPPESSKDGPDVSSRAPVRIASPAVLWRNRDFLHFWMAQGVSAIGSRITRTALPVVAILTLQASPFEVALLGALAVAPGVLVGILAGGYVDRSQKRRLLIACDLVRAVLVAAVPAAWLLNWLDMLQLYVVAAAVGGATALFQIADNAYLPALVGREPLVEANSKVEATEALAEIAGPSVAGMLVAVLTPPVVLIFDSMSYVLSAWLLGRIEKVEPPASIADDSPSIVSDLRLGLRAAYGHPLLRPVYTVAAITALSNGFFLALYMVYTIDTLGLRPELVGILIGAGGIGGLTGAVIAHPIAARFGVGGAMVLLLMLGQACSVCIPLAQGPDWLKTLLLLTHQLLGDGFMVAYLIHAVSLRQTVLPLDVQGRANATLHIQTGLLLPLGALIAGPLAMALGVRGAVWIGVVGGLAAPVVLAVSAVRHLRAMPVPE